MISFTLVGTLLCILFVFTREESVIVGCPLGTWRDLDGKCNRCDLGYVCDGGADQIKCGEGMEPDETRSFCVASDEDISKIMSEFYNRNQDLQPPVISELGSQSDEFTISTRDVSGGTVGICPDGFFCEGDSSDWYICELGKGGSPCGTLPRGSVSPYGSSSVYSCARGTYASPLKDKCMICEPGFSCNNGIRTNCGTNLVSPEYGNTTCRQCEIGTYFVSASRPCAKCPIGTYQSARGSNCTLCTPGNECPKEGLESYSECPAGTFSNSLGTVNCMKCPPGYICSGTGTIIPALCPRGTYADDKRTSCVNCPTGSYCPSPDMAPIPCPFGTYTKSTNQVICSVVEPGFEYSGPESEGAKCLAGFYSTGYTLPCRECDPGFYCPSGSTTPRQVICPTGFFCPNGSGSPTPCPVGTYNNNQGAVSVGQSVDLPEFPYCRPCPRGLLCPPGTSAIYNTDETYLQCPIGYYCPEGTTDIRKYPCYNPDQGHGIYGHKPGLFSKDQCAMVPGGQYVTVSAPMTLYNCPYGYYCPQGSVYPVPCPGGSTTEKLGARGLIECTPCPAGHFCPSFAQNQSLVNVGRKIPCPAGTYRELTGGISLESCTPCKAGIICPNEGLSMVPVVGTGGVAVCPIAHYCPAGSAQSTACPAGTYNGETGGSSLLDCLVCKPGDFCPQGSKAGTECPRGYYCEGGVGTISKIPCPAGTYVDTPGSAGLGNCKVCAAGKYCLKGSEAEIICPAGHYCEERSAMPTPCPAGTYVSTEGSRSVGDCLACTVQKYCPIGCTSPQTCPDGYYNVDLGKAQEKANIYHSLDSSVSEPGDETKSCNKCKPGQFCKGGVATNCLVGTYSKGGWNECQACLTGYVCGSEGTSYEAMLASLCPEGYFCSCELGLCSSTTGLNTDTSSCIKETPGNTMCHSLCQEKCGKGYYCPEGTKERKPTKAGTFIDTCVAKEDGPLCPAGSYCPEGSQKGIKCQAGYKCGSEGLPSPVVCEGGSFSAPGQTSCTDCTAGKYCPKGSLGEVLCPAGHYCEAKSEAPKPCPTGTFLDTTGNETIGNCIKCGAGKYCSGEGLASITGICSPGYICVEGSSTATPFIDPSITVTDITKHNRVCDINGYCPAGSTEPKGCDAGLYMPKEGAIDDSDCASCLERYFCPGTASGAAKNLMMTCPSGFYCPIGSVEGTKCTKGHFCKQYNVCDGVIDGEDCESTEGMSFQEKCHIGTYQDGEEEESCTVCEKGKVCPEMGMTKPAECPEGSYCAGGVSLPQPCPRGTYGSTAPATDGSSTMIKVCKVCKSGHFCNAESAVEKEMNVSKCSPGYVCGPGSQTSQPTIELSTSSCSENAVVSMDYLDYTSCPDGTLINLVFYKDTDGKCQAVNVCYNKADKTTKILGLNKDVTMNVRDYADQTQIDEFSSALVGNGHVCKKGHYCPDGKEEKECPNFTFNPSVGMTRLEDCLLCPNGFICDKVTGVYLPTYEDAIVQHSGCGEGEACVDPSTSGAPPDAAGGQCGRYDPYNKDAISSTDVCKAMEKDLAPAGQVKTYKTTIILSECEEGGTNCKKKEIIHEEEETDCEKGYYCPSGTPYQIPCYPGTYNSEESQSTCTNCEANTYCYYGVSTPTKCPNGYVCAEGSSDSLEQCKIGEIGVDGVDAAHEKRCGAVKGPHYTSFEASVSEELYCAPGYYCPDGSTDIYGTLNGTRKQCPISHSCFNLFDTKTENICPSGTYRDTEGGSTVFDCHLCPIGFKCNPTLPPEPTEVTSDVDNCTLGNICSYDILSSLPTENTKEGGLTNIGSGDMTLIFSTEDINVINEELMSNVFFNMLGGSRTDHTTDPKPCHKGTFCEKISEFDEFPFAPGHASYDSSKKRIATSPKYCPPGKYQDTTGQSTCKNCDVNHFCVTGQIEGGSHPCENGYICDINSTSRYQSACSEGTFFSKQLTGINTCDACTEGYYCPYTAMLGTSVVIDSTRNPFECLAGLLCEQSVGGTPTTGSKTKTPIKHCDAGIICQSTAVAVADPALCDDLSTSKYCKCHKGHYCSGVGMNENDGKCAPGYYCVGGDTTNIPRNSSAQNDAQSDICPIGTFCINGASAPEKCQTGSYAPWIGLSDPNHCLPCTPGQVCDGEGLSAPQSKCPVGYYCHVIGSVWAKVECPIGSYCPEGSVEPRKCPMGSFQDSTGQGVCKPCDAGKTSVEGGNACTSCPDGFKCEVCPANTNCSGSLYQELFSFDYTYVIPCTEGTYGEIEGTCSSCSAGKYCPFKGLGDLTDFDCPTGYYCPEGTVLPRDENKVCPINSFCKGGVGSAEFCGEGHYSRYLNNTLSDSCILCEPGKTCPGGSFNPIEVDCERGYYCYMEPGTPGTPIKTACSKGHYCPAGSGVEIRCRPGTYQDETTKGECKVCEPGFYCPNEANEIHISCPVGYYCPQGTDNYKIYPCPVGTHNNAIEGKSIEDCQLCPAGKGCMMQGIGDISNDLYNCEAGYYCKGSSVSVTPSDDIGNTKCNRGFYCPEGTETEKPCPIGTYNSFFGAQSDVFCLNCPPGYYCPTEGMTDYTSDLRCEPGYYCPPGSIDKYGVVRNDPGSTQHKCKKGRYCPLGSAIQLGCGYGTYSDEEGLAACKVCPAGSYCDELDLITPKSCEKGFYCPSGTVNYKRYPCPIGTYDITGGLSEESGCTPCPPGKFCPTYGMNTEPNENNNCKEGFYCKTNSPTPTPYTDTLGNGLCPEGHYCDSGTPSPTECPIGTYMPTKGAYSLESCVQCLGSYYCDKSGLIYPDKLCPKGYYCPTGTYCVNEGCNDEPTHESSPIPCTKGFFCPEGSYKPTQCEARYYSDDKASECFECPAGSYCPSVDSDIILDCPEGFICTKGLSTFIDVPCEVGTYWIDKETCANCPIGKACITTGIPNDTPIENCKAGYFCPEGAYNTMPSAFKASSTTNGYCGEGLYCTEATTEPSSCPINRRGPSIKGRSLDDCIACNAGYKCEEEGTVIGTDPCDEGFYCSVTIEEPATGSIVDDKIAINGTWRKAACESGRYCPERSARQLYCDRGSYTDQPEQSLCKTCEEGLYCDGVNEKRDCPEYNFCDAGTTYPQFCKDGQYYDGLKSTPNKCSVCPAGKYCKIGRVVSDCNGGYICSGGSSTSTPEKNTGTGEICPIGEYCEPGTSNTGKSCADGLFIFTIGSQNEKQCVPCLPGWKCYDKKTEKCPIGQYCPYGSLPIDCPTSTYNPSLGGKSEMDCRTCPAGYLCLSIGISSLLDHGCPTGHYCVEGAIEATPCPKGTYRDRKNGAKVSDCKVCPKGFYCETGTTVPTPCTEGYFCPEGSYEPKLCKLGTYSGDGFDLHLSEEKTCIPCPKGQYCPDPRKRFSLPCDKGYICTGGSYVKDPTTLEEGGYMCPKGNYCPSGAIVELECPVGTFMPRLGAGGVEDCIPCRENTYNHFPGQESCRYCGPSAVSKEKEGSTSCVCIGENRSYLELEGSCVCMPGFYVNSMFGQETSAGVATSDYQFIDSTIGCIPLTKPNCNQMHRLIDGSCGVNDLQPHWTDPDGTIIVDASTACSSYCYPGLGTLVGSGVSFCECTNSKEAQDVCDSKCMANAPKITVTSKLQGINDEDAFIKITYPLIEGEQPSGLSVKQQSKATSSSSVVGANEVTSNPLVETFNLSDSNVFYGNLWCPQKPTTYNSFDCKAIYVKVGDSGFDAHFEFPETYFHEVVNELSPSNGSTKYSAKSLRNPTLCLKYGDSIIFEVSADYYPVYDKNAIINDNKFFDFSYLKTLKDQIKIINPKTKLFGLSFNSPGVFTFSLSTDPKKLLILRSLGPEENCGDAGSINKTGQLSKSRLGIGGKNAILNTVSESVNNSVYATLSIEPDWRIAAILAIGVIVVIAGIIGLYLTTTRSKAKPAVFRKSDYGLETKARKGKHSSHSSTSSIDPFSFDLGLLASKGSSVASLRSLDLDERIKQFNSSTEPAKDGENNGENEGGAASVNVSKLLKSTDRTLRYTQQNKGIPSFSKSVDKIFNDYVGQDEVEYYSQISVNQAVKDSSVRMIPIIDNYTSHIEHLFDLAGDNINDVLDFVEKTCTKFVRGERDAAIMLHKDEIEQRKEKERQNKRAKLVGNKVEPVLAELKREVVLRTSRNEIVDGVVDEVIGNGAKAVALLFKLLKNPSSEETQSIFNSSILNLSNICKNLEAIACDDPKTRYNHEFKNFFNEIDDMIPYLCKPVGDLLDSRETQVSPGTFFKNGTKNSSNFSVPKNIAVRSEATGLTHPNPGTNIRINNTYVGNAEDGTITEAASTVIPVTLDNYYKYFISEDDGKLYTVVGNTFVVNQSIDSNALDLKIATLPELLRSSDLTGFVPFVPAHPQAQLVETEETAHIVQKLFAEKLPTTAISRFGDGLSDKFESCGLFDDIFGTLFNLNITKHSVTEKDTGYRCPIFGLTMNGQTNNFVGVGGTTADGVTGKITPVVLGQIASSSGKTKELLETIKVVGGAEISSTSKLVPCLFDINVPTSETQRYPIACAIFGTNNKNEILHSVGLEVENNTKTIMVPTYSSCGSLFTMMYFRRFASLHSQLSRFISISAKFRDTVMSEHKAYMAKLAQIRELNIQHDEIVKREVNLATSYQQKVVDIKANMLETFGVDARNVPVEDTDIVVAPDLLPAALFEDITWLRALKMMSISPYLYMETMLSSIKYFGRSVYSYNSSSTAGSVHFFNKSIQRAEETLATQINSTVKFNEKVAENAADWRIVLDAINSDLSEMKMAEPSKYQQYIVSLATRAAEAERTLEDITKIFNNEQARKATLYVTHMTAVGQGNKGETADNINKHLQSHVIMLLSLQDEEITTLEEEHIKTLGEMVTTIKEEVSELSGLIAELESSGVTYASEDGGNETNAYITNIRTFVSEGIDNLNILRHKKDAELSKAKTLFDNTCVLSQIGRFQMNVMRSLVNKSKTVEDKTKEIEDEAYKQNLALILGQIMESETNKESEYFKMLSALYEQTKPTADIQQLSTPAQMQDGSNIQTQQAQQGNGLGFDIQNGGQQQQQQTPLGRVIDQGSRTMLASNASLSGLADLMQQQQSGVFGGESGAAQQPTLLNQAEIDKRTAQLVRRAEKEIKEIQAKQNLAVKAPEVKAALVLYQQQVLEANQEIIQKQIDAKVQIAKKLEAVRQDILQNEEKIEALKIEQLDIQNNKFNELMSAANNDAEIEEKKEKEKITQAFERIQEEEEKQLNTILESRLQLLDAEAQETGEVEDVEEQKSSLKAIYKEKMQTLEATLQTQREMQEEMLKKKIQAKLRRNEQASRLAVFEEQQRVTQELMRVRGEITNKKEEIANAEDTIDQQNRLNKETKSNILKNEQSVAVQLLKAERESTTESNRIVVDAGKQQETLEREAKVVAEAPDVYLKKHAELLEEMEDKVINFVAENNMDTKKAIAKQSLDAERERAALMRSIETCNIDLEGFEDEFQETNKQVVTWQNARAQLTSEMQAKLDKVRNGPEGKGGKTKALKSIVGTYSNMINSIDGQFVDERGKQEEALRNKIAMRRKAKMAALRKKEVEAGQNSMSAKINKELLNTIEKSMQQYNTPAVSTQPSEPLPQLSLSLSLNAPLTPIPEGKGSDNVVVQLSEEVKDIMAKEREKAAIESEIGKAKDEIDKQLAGEEKAIDAQLALELERAEQEAAKKLQDIDEKLDEHNKSSGKQLVLVLSEAKSQEQKSNLIQKYNEETRKVEDTLMAERQRQQAILEEKRRLAKDKKQMQMRDKRTALEVKKLDTLKNSNDQITKLIATRKEQRAVMDTLASNQNALLDPLSVISMTISGRHLVELKELTSRQKEAAEAAEMALRTKLKEEWLNMTDEERKDRGQPTTIEELEEKIEEKMDKKRQKMEAQFGKERFGLQEQQLTEMQRLIQNVADEADRKNPRSVISDMLHSLSMDINSQRKLIQNQKINMQRAKERELEEAEAERQKMEKEMMAEFNDFRSHLLSEKEKALNDPAVKKALEENEKRLDASYKAKVKQMQEEYGAKMTDEDIDDATRERLTQELNQNIKLLEQNFNNDKDKQKDDLVKKLAERRRAREEARRKNLNQKTEEIEIIRKDIEEQRTDVVEPPADAEAVAGGARGFVDDDLEEEFERDEKNRLDQQTLDVIAQVFEVENNEADESSFADDTVDQKEQSELEADAGKEVQVTPLEISKTLLISTLDTEESLRSSLKTIIAAITAVTTSDEAKRGLNTELSVFDSMTEYDEELIPVSFSETNLASIDFPTPTGSTALAESFTRRDLILVDAPNPSTPKLVASLSRSSKNLILNTQSGSCFASFKLHLPVEEPTATIVGFAIDELVALRRLIRTVKAIQNLLNNGGYNRVCDNITLHIGIASAIPNSSTNGTAGVCGYGKSCCVVANYKSTDDDEPAALTAFVRQQRLRSPDVLLVVASTLCGALCGLPVLKPCSFSQLLSRLVPLVLTINNMKPETQFAGEGIEVEQQDNGLTEMDRIMQQALDKFNIDGFAGIPGLGAEAEHEPVADDVVEEDPQKQILRVEIEEIEKRIGELNMKILDFDEKIAEAKKSKNKDGIGSVIGLIRDQAALKNKLKTEEATLNALRERYEGA